AEQSSRLIESAVRIMAVSIRGGPVAGSGRAQTGSRRRCAGAPSLPRAAPEMHNDAMFEWSDLRYFIAVAREGSTLAASRALRTSQSTVQRRLTELEGKLGC